MCVFLRNTPIVSKLLLQMATDHLFSSSSEKKAERAVSEPTIITIKANKLFFNEIQKQPVGTLNAGPVQIRCYHLSWIPQTT